MRRKTRVRPYKSEESGFRFFHLDENQSKNLQELCADTSLRRRKDDPRFFVRTLSLEPDRDYRWIKQFILQHAIPESEYGFFISTVTESLAETICVPEYVVKLIRELGGELDFSFSYVGSD